MESTQSFAVPRFIRTHFRYLTHTDRWFYTCLIDLCGSQKSCALSFRKPRRETGLSLATLCRSIDVLRQVGLIQAVKKASLESAYEIWHITLISLTHEQAILLSQEHEPLPKEKTTPELEKLPSQLQRAQEANVPATLTLGEWLATLEYFEWKCPYCQGPYEVIEHFVPIVLGGGATKSNCVPACNSCNNRKGSYHPLLMPSTTGMNEAIEVVQAYLAASRNGVEA